MSALAALFTIAAAAAQTVSGGAGDPQPSGPRRISAPAEKYTVSPGGVDMRTGMFVYKQTDISIGGEGESGGLSLDRITAPNPYGHLTPFGGMFSSNWEIMLTDKRIDIFRGLNDDNSGPDYRIRIFFGGRSETFSGYGNQTGFIQMSQNPLTSLTYTGDRASGTALYTFTATDGTAVTFRPVAGMDCSAQIRCAYVSTIVEPDGTLLSFDYDYDAAAVGNRARLRSITSSRGYALVLEGGGNLTTKACVLNLTQAPLPANRLCPANAPATVTYSYSGGQLTGVTTASNVTQSFTYSANNVGFVKPGQSTPWLTNSYGGNGGGDEDFASWSIVGAQSFADGQSYTYSYDYAPEIDGKPDVLAGGSYTDALAHKTIVRFDFPLMPNATNPGYVFGGGYPYVNFGDLVYQVTPGPTQIIDPLDRKTTFDYCDRVAAAGYPSYERNRCVVGRLQSFTDPEGAKTDLYYDASRTVSKAVRHAKVGSNQEDITTLATHSCGDASLAKICAKPTSVTDARQRTTDYAYDPAHGGVLTETGPAGANGVRPQTRYSYAQRTAWIANGTGWVAAGPPVWLLVRKSLCKVGAATAVGCAVAGDEIVTIYDYGPDAGPNNLRLRGMVVDDGGLSLRTCYAYDTLGNKISETKPRASLGSCP
ncbi:MAG: hypothetical protein JO013_03525 [Alphaproteobacteria bacterium]|nr:hypothetical protein [Alphaproteobacteria bacterium]